MDSTFTVEQWCVFIALRRGYGPYFDMFSAHEMAHLRLIRWLYEGGKLVG
jgi:hypothetical protein